MQEFISTILTSSNRDLHLLVDANVNTKYLKGAEGRTYTTSAVNAEKTGGWFERALPQGHILDFPITRKDFKDAPLGELTISVLNSSVTLIYNTNASVVYCAHCSAPTNTSLTGYLGQEFGVCQKLSSPDFGLLVLANTSPRILLATDEGCLGWSSMKTGSISFFEKGLTWYNTFYVR
ncbi:MAG: hypothetical protein Q7S79_00530 [bacterium]|nr:hypothetical protein [bacterium]